MAFRQKPFNYRCQLSAKLLAYHPDRVPVIVEPQGSIDDFEMSKTKFLASVDSTLGSFIVHLKKYIPIKQSSSLVLLINDKILPNNYTMRHIYEKYHDNDKFLYIKYRTENTFGSL